MNDKLIRLCDEVIAAIDHPCDCCAAGGYRSNCNCDEQRREFAAPILAKALKLALERDALYHEPECGEADNAAIAARLDEIRVELAALEKELP